jgi:hypothetical protein
VVVRLLKLIGVAITILTAPCAANATEIFYFATLSGVAASPPNESAGTGTALVYLDTALAHLHLEINYSGLAGAVVSAHLQGLTAAPGLGVADSLTMQPSLSGFATGSTAGSYHGILDLNFAQTYNPDFVDAYGGAVAQARAAVESGLGAGRIYFNIRTTTFVDGEIRGFLAPNPTADFDRNGRVEAADLNLWTIAFGGANFGDADQDGDTDGSDFLLWQRQLGQVAEIPHHHHAAAAGNTVPEPPAAVAAAIGLLSTAAFCRRSFTTPRHRNK